LRKNNFRQEQLKKIDTENLKIFQNLLRIKSSLSKQKIEKHADKNANLKNMLSQYDKRLDPMVSLHKMKSSQGGGRRYQSPFMMRATANTSIGGGSTGETGRKNNTTYSG
jgi:hypothetical protein